MCQCVDVCLSMATSLFLYHLFLMEYETGPFVLLLAIHIGNGFGWRLWLFYDQIHVMDLSIGLLSASKTPQHYLVNGCMIQYTDLWYLGGAPTQLSVHILVSTVPILSHIALNGKSKCARTRQATMHYYCI